MNIARLILCSLVVLVCLFGVEKALVAQDIIFDERMPPSDVETIQTARCPHGTIRIHLSNNPGIKSGSKIKYMERVYSLTIDDVPVDEKLIFKLNSLFGIRAINYFGFYSCGSSQNPYFRASVNFNKFTIGEIGTETVVFTIRENELFID